MATTSLSVFMLVKTTQEWLAAQTKIKSRERKREDEDGIEDDEPF
ncbi:hypothetical protein [Pseudomonas sp. EL_65y_Pfl2_R96]